MASKEWYDNKIEMHGLDTFVDENEQQLPRETLQFGATIIEMVKRNLKVQLRKEQKGHTKHNKCVGLEIWFRAAGELEFVPIEWQDVFGKILDDDETVLEPYGDGAFEDSVADTLEEIARQFRGTARELRTEILESWRQSSPPPVVPNADAWMHARRIVKAFEATANDVNSFDKVADWRLAKERAVAEEIQRILEVP